MRRTIPLGLFVFGLLLGLSMSSRSSNAHVLNDYPSNGWKYTVLNRVFYQAPNDWPNTYNARTSDAMDTWTNLNNAAISFTLAGDASTGTWGCGTSFDLVREKDVPAGYMTTSVCLAANSTTRIAVDDNRPWYLGAATPNPMFTTDFQSYMTHELGHALQAWNNCTDGLDEDPCEGGHYDTTFNAARCPGSTDPPNHHTMCRSPSSTDEWRWRSLEEHDKDLVQDMY